MLLFYPSVNETIIIKQLKMTLVMVSKRFTNYKIDFTGFNIILKLVSKALSLPKYLACRITFCNETLQRLRKLEDLQR